MTPIYWVNIFFNLLEMPTFATVTVLLKSGSCTLSTKFDIHVKYSP